MKTKKTLYYFRKNHLCGPCIRINKPVVYEMSLKNLKPEIANYWHPTKNRFGPEHYSPGSDKKVWWLCPVVNDCGCLHEFEAKILDKVKTHENNKNKLFYS